MIGLGNRIEGALYGGAIGDAMGGPAEGMPPNRVREAFPGEDCTRFLPFLGPEDVRLRKGDGRITDDTLMTEALIRAYIRRRGHLDAYDFDAFFLPEVAETPVWIPEMAREMPILDRLWWPERYPYIRLRVNNAEPRAAGRGNLVNCGVAMTMMPVGAANAGDPRGAYQEAAAFASAHNESYALEAGAVTAAAYARAFAADSGIEAVLDTALELARDGTRDAIRAVLNAADAGDPLDRFVTKTREAVAPFDPRTGHGSDDDPMIMAVRSDFGTPSRLHSIEELPIALAALRYGSGDFCRTLAAGVFYGRDCDSIAGIAGGLFGAVFGSRRLPADLRAGCDAANRRDFSALAAAFHDAVRDIFRKDTGRFADRGRAME